jgi:hypothetical protein
MSGSRQEFENARGRRDRHARRWGGDIHDSMQSIRLRGSHAFGFGLSLSDLSRRSETIPLTQMLNAFTSSGQ